MNEYATKEWVTEQLANFKIPPISPTVSIPENIGIHHVGEKHTIKAIFSGGLYDSITIRWESSHDDTIFVNGGNSQVVTFIDNAPDKMKLLSCTVIAEGNGHRAAKNMTATTRNIITYAVMENGS